MLTIVPVLHSPLRRRRRLTPRTTLRAIPADVPCGNVDQYRIGAALRAGMGAAGTGNMPGALASFSLRRLAAATLHPGPEHTVMKLRCDTARLPAPEVDHVAFTACLTCTTVQIAAAPRSAEHQIPFAAVAALHRRVERVQVHWFTPRLLVVFSPPSICPQRRNGFIRAWIELSFIELNQCTADHLPSARAH
jgi:hypothetical protein